MCEHRKEEAVPVRVTIGFGGLSPPTQAYNCHAYWKGATISYHAGIGCLFPLQAPQS